MDTVMDSTAFEQQLLKLGLATEGQLAEIHEEIGDSPDLSHLISALERKSYLTPWQRGKVLKGDFDGFFMGGFRILYKISSGSFGRVFRAEDPRDGRVVAIKILRRRWSEDEKRIDLFIREGKVGLTLEHPYIVKVLAINRDSSSGQYYLIMEFVEGGNLREILQIRKKLTVAESLRIIENATSGLAYAYSRGMTHRDIKLTNLLISSQGEAKLVDFGLAQFFASFAREDEKVDRTVDYAGLEKATNVKMGDVRSDLYFLGCVLYECLTGRSPIVMTRDKHARMRKERFEQVQPINPAEIDGPPAVLTLVETMMSLDPKQRYQTPSQLLDAVKALRREVENKSGRNSRPPARSVFLVESDDHLRDVLRDGLKDQGYRIFTAGDPVRALDRFHQQPFDGLIVDARTTGEDGRLVYEHILEEASRKGLPCAAILILAEDQASWAARVPTAPHSAVMRHDVKFKQLVQKLRALMAAAHPIFYTCTACGAQIPEPEKLVDDKVTCLKCGAEVFVGDDAEDDQPATPAPRSREDLADVEDVPPPRHAEPSWQAKPSPMRHAHPMEPPAAALAHDPRAWRDEVGPPSLTREKGEAKPRTWNPWAKMKPIHKGIVIALGVLALALFIFYKLPGKVTQENFDKIEVGMSEAEVASIMGEGEEESSPIDADAGSKVKSAKTVTWEHGSKKILVIFANGKVTMKNFTNP